MAEFLTMDEAKSKFGSKSRTNAGLALGIIGTSLAVLGNNGGCGCGGNGILGGLFGNNCNCAMQAADQARAIAMALGEASLNLAWANRVQSMQDDIDLYTYVSGVNNKLGNEVLVLTNLIWNDRVQDFEG